MVSTTMPITRVAFVWPDLGWMGGINYFRSLFYALHHYADGTVEPVLFTGKDSDTYGLEAYAKVVRTPLLDKKSLPWMLSKSIKAMTGGRELLLKRLLDQHNIEVISHYNWLWKGCAIRSLAWIPDFQVLHLPECFPEQDRQATTAAMANAIKKSDAMLLSSEHAKSDLYHFCQDCLDAQAPHSYVLHFPSSFSGTLDELPSIDMLREKYNLSDEPWFHVPNQFWMHKNHSLIIQALKHLHKGGKAPLVLATGVAKDFRNPDYVPELKRQLSDENLSDRFRVMGQIPYMDMMGLMLHAIAVINPSRFEGWSTTVEEAKAFGKKLILSDIEVHREQNPDRSYYVAVDDSEKLAELLSKCVLSYNAIEERELSLNVFADKEKSMKEFSNSYVSLILDLKTGCAT